MTEEERLKRVESGTYDWGAFFSTPTGKVIGGIIVSLLMLAASWITDRTKPVTPIINVTPSVDVAPIIVPSAKVVVYLTTSTKDLKLQGVQIDARIYPDGSTYTFGSKSIPLPCMAWFQDSKVADVQPFTKAEEVVTYLKKVIP